MLQIATRSSSRETVFVTDAYDMSRQPDFVRLLAKTDFVPSYLALCAKYAARVGIDGPHMDMVALYAIFRNSGVKTRWHKRFKTFEFEDEIIAGWEWKGSLVVQTRICMLEPMMDGHKGKCAVGSTWLSLARDAGDLCDPPVRITAPAPRPNFDGDMRTMERMVPDLIALFRSVKKAIRENW
jgi:hypothetical protein